MTSGNSRAGFTLIEVLVASLLLGMLVSILTMVFNQNAIAWRTGKAGVAQLSDLRHRLARAQRLSENVLPGVDATSAGKVGTVVSPWKETDRKMLKRGVGEFRGGSDSFSMPSFQNANPQPWAEVRGLKNIRSGSEKTYIVGVLSYGPDGKKDTDDDITSWPENVQ